MKKNVLLVGPSPHLLEGVSKSVSNFLSSELKSKYKLAYFETGKGINGDLGIRSTISRIFSQFLNFISVLDTEHDIIHIHTSSFGGFWRFGFYALICKIKDKPLIFHIHGGGFENFYVGSNILFKLFIRLILSISSTLIVLSNSWKDVFQEIVPNSRIEVLPNSVKFLKHSSIKKNKSNEINILFLGRFSKLKGINELIEVIPDLVLQNKSIIFNIAGSKMPKEERLFSRLIKISRKNELQSNINLIVNLRGIKKHEIFMKTQIYVLPSFVEGLPFTILEAMSYGIPIITTRVGSIPEVVVENKNGLFADIGSAEDLSQKIKFLVNNPNLCEKMGKQNRKDVEKYYSHKVVFKKISTIYENLLSKNIQQI